MSFFKRLFSSDYRAAVNAEAAGDLDLAAERYAMAGNHEQAVRMHLARAARAETAIAEIAALREAIHWVAPDGPQRKQVAGALGKALLIRAQSEGIATGRDRDRVSEAAKLLVEAEMWAKAGEAWEAIGNDQEAINAYSQGGLVERLEKVLARDTDRTRRSRELRDSFADYEMHLASGNRDRARDELRDCIEAAENKGDYRRLLDELESKLITGGKVTLRPRRGDDVVLCGGSPITMGRDALCDLVLRSGGVSRRHAEVTVGRGQSRFELADAGSRNGTLVGGMPIAGAVPLVDRGSFALGEAYTIDYEVDGEALRLRVTSGLEKGTVLIAADDGEAIDLGGVGYPLTLQFRNGRPILSRANDEVRMLLNGELLAHGVCQLIHGDVLSVDGVELEVP